MSPSRYIFTLDLRSTQAQIVLPVTQGDTNREFLISFSDGGKPFVLGSRSTAMMSIVYPTGTSIQEFCEADSDGARVLYKFSEYTCPGAGLHTCQIVLYNAEGKQIASPKFSINASAKLVAGDDVVIPDEDITAIDAIYREEVLRQSAETAREEAEKERVAAEEQRKTNTNVALSEINNVKCSIEEMRDNGDFNGIDGKNGYSPSVIIIAQSYGYQIFITDKDGTTSATLYNGKNGKDGDKGDKGERGEKGEGFSIAKTYKSVALMNAGFATDGVPVGGFVLIQTGNVEDTDNAKLYVKDETEYSYLIDLSGATGIKGEKGDPGDKGERGEPGEKGEDGNFIGIINVVESTESGGNNVVTFSTGTTLTIKNGIDGVGISNVEKIASNGLVDTYKITLANGASRYYTITNGKDGKDGTDGTSVKVLSVTQSTESGGKNDVVFSDGNAVSIYNGRDGKTAYEYAQDSGYIGSEADFSMKLAQPVPSKTSQITNDSGYITENAVKVKSVNGKTGDVSLDSESVGADKKGTASSAVTTHNASEAAHGDIRLLISSLAERLNAIANSTDIDLDDFKEVVAYIKSNRSLIDNITTNKVGYADIVNDLVSNVTNKPLSAAQGVALKALIDAISIPKKVSELANDKGYLTSYAESDPTVPAWAKESTKPSYSKNEVGLGNVDNVKQYSASNPPPYPVTLVNGKSGNVSLTLSDFGLSTESWTFELEDGSTVTKKVAISTT